MKVKPFISPRWQPLCRNVGVALGLWLTLTQHLQAGDISSDGKSVPVQSTVAAVDWREFAISPVSNPIFFEDLRIETGARLIFLEQRVTTDVIIHF